MPKQARPANARGPCWQCALGSSPAPGQPALTPSPETRESSSVPTDRWTHRHPSPSISGVSSGIRPECRVPGSQIVGHRGLKSSWHRQAPAPPVHASMPDPPIRRRSTLLAGCRLRSIRRRAENGWRCVTSPSEDNPSKKAVPHQLGVRHRSSSGCCPAAWVPSSSMSGLTASSWKRTSSSPSSAARHLTPRSASAYYGDPSMTTRRKAIKVLPHERKLLVKLYLKYRLPIEQLEARPVR